MDCTVALCLHQLTFPTAQECWWGIRLPGQTQNRSTNRHKHILVSDFAKWLAKNVSLWELNIWNVQLCCLPLCNSCIPSWKQHASSAETLQFSILHEGTPSQRHSFPSQLAPCLLIICEGHSVQCNQFLGWLKKEHKVRGVLFGGPFRAAVQLLTWRLEGQYIVDDGHEPTGHQRTIDVKVKYAFCSTNRSENVSGCSLMMSISASDVCTINKPSVHQKYSAFLIPGLDYRTSTRSVCW